MIAADSSELLPLWSEATKPGHIEVLLKGGSDVRQLLSNSWICAVLPAGCPVQSVLEEVPSYLQPLHALLLVEQDLVLHSLARGHRPGAVGC